MIRRTFSALAMAAMLLGCSARQGTSYRASANEMNTPDKGTVADARPASPSPAEVSVMAIGGLIDGRMVWWTPEGEVTKPPVMFSPERRPGISFESHGPEQRWVVVSCKIPRFTDEGGGVVNYSPALYPGREPGATEGNIQIVTVPHPQERSMNSTTLVGFTVQDRNEPISLVCELPSGKWRTVVREFDREGVRLLTKLTAPEEAQPVRVLLAGERPDRVRLLVEGDEEPIPAAPGPFRTNGTTNPVHLYEFRDTGVTPSHRIETRIDSDRKYYLNGRHYPGVELGWMRHDSVLLENLPAMPKGRAVASR